MLTILPVKKCFFSKILLFSSIFVILQTTKIYSQICYNNRYTQPIFTNVDVLDEVYYGTAPALVYPPYVSEISTYNKDLKMDIYLPQGDTLSKRPVVVMAFGGAFLVGFKEQPQLVALCNYLAQCGYVVVSIDYRLGFNSASTNSTIRAVYRAVQDMHAAIRFLKHNHSTYKIDTTLVFAGGNSAGGVTALHSAYLSENDRSLYPIFAPTYGGGLFLNWPNLGCIDCTGNNYVHNGNPTAVINLWGAIADTLFMKSATDAPVVSFHGTADLIVLPNIGSPFNYPGFPALYGSIPIHQRAENLKMKNELNLFEGQGHEPWIDNTVANEINTKSANFLYKNMLKPNKPTLNGNFVVCPNSLETYTIPLTAGYTYCWYVEGGSIVNTNAKGNTITVQWGSGSSAQITARQFSRNAAESDTLVQAITIANLLPPTLLNVEALNINTLVVNWDTANIGALYTVFYKTINNTNWQSVTTTTNLVNIPNLAPCTTYQVNVQATCGTQQGAVSYTAQATTPTPNFVLKAFIEGAYNTTTLNLNNYLTTNNLLPHAQPFNIAPYLYNGTEIAPTLPANATDWVLVQLYDSATLTLQATAAALLLQNGNIVNPQNIDTPLEICTLLPQPNNQKYYIVIRHRNHLPIVSKNAITVYETNYYDFSIIGNSHPLTAKNIAGIATLIAGDASQNGVISHHDFNSWYLQNNTLNTYSNPDFNLDGIINENDFDLYRNNASKITLPFLR